VRFFFSCLLATVWTWTNAFAGEAEEAAFRFKIISYIETHPPLYPADLKDIRTEGRVTVAFAIDRDGKLVDASMPVGSGSAKADQNFLDWLTRLQPFPHVPLDLSAPAKFSVEVVLVPRERLSDVRIKLTMDAGASASGANFQDLVVSHLQHLPRTYSDDMGSRQGPRRAVMAILIDQDGRLLNVEIVKGSGSPKLDQETLAWLKSGQPYPQIPTDLKSPLRLTAEIGFEPPRIARESIWNDEKIKRAISNVCKGC
jgi:TonB family protein